MPEPYDWLAKLAREDYPGYLATSHWRNLRSAALARHEGRCAQCGFDPDGMTDLLEVHHLTYERVACEQPDDLEVLCRRCHAGRHPDKRPPSVHLEPDPHVIAAEEDARAKPDEWWEVQVAEWEDNVYGTSEPQEVAEPSPIDPSEVGDDHDT